jgi:membrane-bound lytic murein transglycosylase D
MHHRNFFQLMIITLLVNSGLSGCSSQRIKPDHLPDTNPSQDSAQVVDEIEKEILSTDANIDHHDDMGRPSAIPVEINRNVRKWIHYFSVQDKERFQRFIDRGAIYKDTVQNILRENQVPVELYYLAMIESGYVTHAQSHAAAVGAWQFVKGTSTRYGLDTNVYLDERRDIIRSTEAAAKYLKGLYTVFQSWYLAMASYNAGEGRILGAILRGHGRDFWKLVEAKALPPETRDYVPKFLAASIIGKNPSKYGFKVSKASTYPKVKSAAVPGGVSLASISQVTQIDTETLKFLNPHLIRQATPSNRVTYEIWVPQGKERLVADSQDALYRLRKLEKRVVRTTASSSRRPVSKKTVYHHVKKGERLTLISKKYGVSIQSLKKMNALRGNTIFAGQRLKVVSQGI